MLHGLIFAAGLGTRLKPLTDRMPKALVPLAGKSLLQWQVEKLRDAGITDIVVNVHHFPDMIINTVRENEGWGTHITISDERDFLLDTGGGLRKAKDLLEDGPVLACNVDILSNIDLRALISEWQRVKEQTMGLLVVSERKTQRYLCFDEANRLCGWTNIATGEVRPASMQGKIGSNHRLLAFSGMQILSPDIFDRMDQVVAQKGDKFSLIDLYLSLLNSQSPIPNHQSPILAYVPSNYRMMDVGKIDQIAEAETFAESL